MEFTGRPSIPFPLWPPKTSHPRLAQPTSLLLELVMCQWMPLLPLLVPLKERGNRAEEEMKARLQWYGFLSSLPLCCLLHVLDGSVLPFLLLPGCKSEQKWWEWKVADASWVAGTGQLLLLLTPFDVRCNLSMQSLDHGPKSRASCLPPSQSNWVSKMVNPT